MRLEGWYETTNLVWHGWYRQRATQRKRLKLPIIMIIAGFLVSLILLSVFFGQCVISPRPRRVRETYCAAGGKGGQTAGVGFEKIGKAGGGSLWEPPRGLYLWCYKSWYYKFPRGTRAFALRRPQGGKCVQCFF